MTVLSRGRPRSVRRVRLVAACAAATALAVAGCGSSADAKSPQLTFNAAQQLQRQGDLGDAAQLFQQVLATEPDNYRAMYNLGVIAQQQRNPAAALYQYGRALKLNPRYVPALYNSATIYADTRPLFAETVYRQVVKLQPVAPTAYLNLGLLELKHGEPRRGVSDLATAVSQDSSLVRQIPAHLRTLVESQVPHRQVTTASPTSVATARP